MLEVQEVALRRALRTLESLKDEVKFAVEFGDEVYGNATLAPEKSGIRTRKYAFGETRAYYEPLIRDMEPDDAIEVPFGKFDGAVLSGNISSWCFREWGRGNYTVSINRATNTVGVMREA